MTNRSSAAMLPVMRTDLFDYHLPPERIAQEPLAERDASKLLHLERATHRWTDRTVRDLPELLRDGDLLVLNDTRVIPARLRARRELSGGNVEIFLLPPECEGHRAEIRGQRSEVSDQGRDQGTEPQREGQSVRRSEGQNDRTAEGQNDGTPNPNPKSAIPSPQSSSLPAPRSSSSITPSPDRSITIPETLRRVLTRSGGKLRVGETFTLANGLQARLVERCGEAGDVVAFNLPPAEFLTYVTQHGEVPLPPYIKRPAGPSTEQDKARYQTVFAREPGAVAAPTAGLHFTPALLERLDARGIQRAAITLHVGPGTFKPVKVDTVEEHRVDPEPFTIGADVAGAVTRAKAEGRRVVVVGTTVMRVLENRWNAEAQRLDPGAGMADLFIYPPRRFHVADALLTNFHLPKSSLLMLVAAFASPGDESGIEWVKSAYSHAVGSYYRFYSYGDACFIE